MLHEVLWMLQVPTDCALFYQDDNDKFHVKADVSMPSTIPVSVFKYSLVETVISFIKDHT